MLKLIPEADVEVVERCSGHGGSWGFKNGNFDTALKIGRPVARTVRDGNKAFVTSECPLAGVHIAQGVARQNDGKPAEEQHTPTLLRHPIQLMAKAYNLPY